jgi:hypothetical protein
VAKNKVYDTMPFLAMGPQAHPGGMSLIKRKAGTDVTRDYNFHSAKARKQLWSEFEIGFLAKCVLGTTRRACGLFYFFSLQRHPPHPHAIPFPRRCDSEGGPSSGKTKSWFSRLW